MDLVWFLFLMAYQPSVGYLYNTKAILSKEP